MKSSLQNIKFIFLAVILLPTLIFSIYEIGTFRENERVIDSIYGNQLDAILYSVNQYSDDVLSGWANAVEDVLAEEDEEFELKNYLQQVSAIRFLYQYSSDDKLVAAYSNDSIGCQAKVMQLVKQNRKISSQLTRYIDEGYRKLEPFKLEKCSLQLIVFAVVVHGEKRIVALGFNPQQFIHEVLDPKIQEITQDKFYIGAMDNATQGVIYNSDKGFTPKGFKYKKAFWLLSDYHIGIELKDQTINELVKARSRKNLYLIIIIDFVLIFGAVLIYRNINKQIELSRIKSDFISNVSHEIRTPLALISMYVETLDMGRVKTEDKKKEYYGIINQETRRLSNMVNNILNFSKIENNKRKYTLVPVDINAIVENVLTTFKYQLESKGFTLKVKLHSNLPMVNADNDAVTEALINLIDNAVKYSEEHKLIVLTSGCFENGVFIEVSDKGIGISESEQKRIFDKFYRVTEKNLAHKAKGSGLGLAIVQHVMHAHSGKVTVNAKTGEGSRFRLLFPKINYTNE